MAGLRHPSQQAAIGEARGLVESDRTLLSEAANRYSGLELPYHEARRRLEAGELNRAREIIDGYGLGDGPLGARRLELEGAAR